jgi:hypothetical protein
MPQDKDFKRLVRARMAQTGERYTRARLTVMREPGREDEPRRGAGELLALMALPGVPGRENEGFLRTQALAPDDCRRVALRGLRHEDWRVRRRCAQLLDDLTLTDEAIAALTNALRDGHPGVRKAALHSLVCVHCKPDGCALDVRSTAASMLADPNADVRRQAVGAFRFVDDAETLELLRHVASTDRSAGVRDLASELIADKERRTAAEAKRRELPDDLRRKTERHPGKWVAIADGKIICAHRFPGRVRRDLRAVSYDEAVVVWVAPSEDGAQEVARVRE